MTGLVGAAVLILVVVASLLFVVRGSRVGKPALRTSDLASYQAPSKVGGLVSGLVAAVAASGAANLGQLGTGTSVGVGASVGVAFAIIAAIGSTTVLGIATAGFALLGAGGAVASLMLGASCSTVDTGTRAITLVILAATASVGIFAAIVTGRFHLRSLLAVVGSVRVLMFIASPMGVALVDLPLAAWLVACTAAALFGWLAGIAPDFSMGICALVVGLTALAASASFGTPCSVGGNPGDFLTVAGFIACYALCRVVLRALVRPSLARR